MSTVKISELPVLSSADAADEFVVVDDSAGVTKKITQAGLADFGSNALTAGTVTASGLVTASSGINFGSDTLDDYEEGTWTPKWNVIVTYNYQGGSYVKIGNVVFASFDLQTDAAPTTTAGSLRLANLPFVVTSPGTNQAVTGFAKSFGNNWDAGNQPQWFQGILGDNRAEAHYESSGQQENLPHTAIDVSTRIAGTFIYEIS